MLLCIPKLLIFTIIYSLLVANTSAEMVHVLIILKCVMVYPTVLSILVSVKMNGIVKILPVQVGIKRSIVFT